MKKRLTKAQKRDISATEHDCKIVCF